jgi:hypothetical protein
LVFIHTLDEPETTDISLQQLIQQNYNLLDEDDGCFENITTFNDVGPLSVSLPNARSLDDIRPLLQAFRFMNNVQRGSGYRRTNERVEYPAGDSDDDIDLIDADQVSSDDSSDEEDDRTTTISDDSYEGIIRMRRS